MKIGKYFNDNEFACKCGCGFNSIDKQLVNILDAIRENLNRPLKINSGCRCEKHNKACGSSADNHTKGVAVDIATANSEESFEIVREALRFGIKRIGIAKTFIHLDVNNKPNSMWLY